MIERQVADPEGAPLPRVNGELVFEAPWEGRAFGLAVVLNRAGYYPWEAFRERLVEQIAGTDGPYYERWLAALESVVLAHGLVKPEELEQRIEAIRSGQRDDVF